MKTPLRDAPAPASRKRRARGVRRLLVYGSLAVGVALFFQSALFRKVLFSKFRQYVEDRYSVRLTVKDWGFSLADGWLTVRGLYAEDLYGSFFIDIPEVKARFSAWEAVMGRPALESVSIDGPKVLVISPFRGQDRWKSGPTQGSEFRIPELSVRGGGLKWDDMDIPVDMECRALFFHSSTGGTSSTKFRLAMRGLTAFGSGFGIRMEGASVDGEWDGKTLRMLAMESATPFSQLRGTCFFSLSRGGDFDMRGEGELDLEEVRSMLPMAPVRLGGGVRFGIRANRSRGSPVSLEGEMEGSGLRVGPVELDRLSARLAMRGGEVECSPVSAVVRGAGGVDGTARFNPATRSLSLAARCRGFSLGGLLRRFRPGSRGEGSLTASIGLDMPPGRAPALEVDGTVTGGLFPYPNADGLFACDSLNGKLTWSPGSVAFDIAELEGGSISASASGSFVRGELRVDPLKVRAESGNVAKGLLEKVAHLSPELVENLSRTDLRGPADLACSLRLKGPSPTVVGDVFLGDVTLGGVHLGDVSGRLDLSPSRLVLTDVQAGGAGASFQIDLGIAPSTRLQSIQLAMKPMDSASVESLVDYFNISPKGVRLFDFLGGMISFDISLDLPDDGPKKGRFHLSADDVKKGDNRLGNLEFEGVLESGVLKFTNLSIEGRAVDIAGVGRWCPEDGEVRFSGQIRRLSLEGLSETRKSGLAGDLSGIVEVSGRLPDPLIEVHLDSEKLVFSGEPFGDFNLAARMERGVVNFSTRAEHRQNLYTATGQVFTKGDPRLEATVFLDRTRVQPFVRQFWPAHADKVQGEVSGKLDMTLPFLRPTQVEVDGEISEIDIRYDDQAIRNTQPVYVRLRNRKLDLQGGRFQWNGRQFDVEGDVNLFPMDRMQLSVKGSLGLDILRDAVPGIRFGGEIGFETLVKGNPEDPVLSGRMDLRDVSVKAKTPELVMEKINGVLDLSNRSLRAESVEFRTKYGRGTIDGECVLGFLRPMKWNLSIRSDRMAATVPSGFLTEFSGGLRFAGTPENSLLSGEIWIDKSMPVKDYDILELAAVLSDATGGGAQPANSPAGEAVKLKIDVHADRSIVFDSSQINLVAGADFQVSGDAGHPVVRGNLVIHSGEIQFQTNRFNVDRGIVGLTGTVPLDPEIHAQLSSDIKDYHVLINVDGAFSKMKTRFSSVPGLAVVDVVRLIISGDLPSVSDRSLGDNYQNNDTANILGQILSQTLERRLKHTVGVDTFSLNTYSSSTDANPKARITVGKQISRDLYVTYSKTVSDEEQDLIFVEYRVTPKLTIVASRDEQGYFGVDFRFKKRFR